MRGMHLADLETAIELPQASPILPFGPPDVRLHFLDPLCDLGPKTQEAVKSRRERLKERFRVERPARGFRLVDEFLREGRDELFNRVIILECGQLQGAIYRWILRFCTCKRRWACCGRGGQVGAGRAKRCERTAVQAGETFGPDRSRRL